MAEAPGQLYTEPIDAPPSLLEVFYFRIRTDPVLKHTIEVIPTVSATDDTTNNELKNAITQAVTTRDEELKQKNLSVKYQADMTQLTDEDWRIIRKALKDFQNPLPGQNKDFGVALFAELGQEHVGNLKIIAPENFPEITSMPIPKQ